MEWYNVVFTDAPPIWHDLSSEYSDCDGCRIHPGLDGGRNMVTVPLSSLSPDLNLSLVLAYLATTTLRTAAAGLPSSVFGPLTKYTPGASARTSFAPDFRSITFRPVASIKLEA